ncbi:ATP-binding cassette domain-containing protein [Lutimaribacter sp. EGI FJ00015]|uniref:ATP-binding cassette domain-containing protein n=1 Tax=Lutimaribacter degradans TaxID=2945989 RepID=A0ACC6A000_9RHOB|nr:ATP-binding cassette domain-containing protein [Lutimaribacter sp. EGI FJ00013]MCM2563622.1 ATP-binding cassette domain-containing protein [Lutimaribacter sp. EGI FJ00013]MCO0614842.1 ATP-binding cassette domain-containing protein [Lutimaribacter sp. EGI FJ00015]MCO0637474.1 ATP-binding cassette domain-containing protein [Lutimaribacter sp. EGI FJ00014]
MRWLWRIYRLLWRGDRVAMRRGLALSVAVLVAGVALLGLSGWFITAAAAAGLAGAGAIFDVFRPSAGVRFLALGRTAARYGERILTHDATLRALANLRVRLLSGVAARPWRQLARMRGSQALNRIVADVDALDGVMLRLAIPLIAGATTLALTFVVLAWLAAPIIALWSIGLLGLGGAAALGVAAMRSRQAARRAEAAMQALRTRSMDLMRAKTDLVMHGVLERAQADFHDAASRMETARAEVDRAEHRAALALALSALLAAIATLGLGASLAQSGILTPAQAALGFFATLALAEIFAPLRRGMADLGRMMDAARRVGRQLDKTGESQGPASARERPAHLRLSLQDVGWREDTASAPVLSGITLDVGPGDTVALTGPSGCGKSTILHIAAGLLQPAEGRALLGGRDMADWSEPDLRAEVGLLAQRSVLTRGTVANILQLAMPTADEAEMRRVLDAVALSPVLASRGGLQAELTEAGTGLSGGETRRLALARVLMRQPAILLLDEPTTGLDGTTARAVLDGIRAICPNSALVLAAHSPIETEWVKMSGGSILRIRT